MIRQARLILLVLTVTLLARADNAAEEEEEDVSSTTQRCDPTLNGEDCAEYPYELCDESEMICVHKDVFPVETLELVGYCLLPILFAVASVGGVGGGIILIPLLIGLFFFTTKDAIATASAVVWGSATLRFVTYSAYAPHPVRPRATQIDYNLVRAVFPAFLTGSYFGVILSVGLGELPLAILIMLVLSLLTIQVVWKAVKLYKKESEQKRMFRLKSLELGHLPSLELPPL